MVPAPIAIGLNLCHYAAVEEGSQNVTLAGCFLGVEGEEFPFTPPPFYVYCALIGGQGAGTVELVVSELETDEELFTVEGRLEFPDRFSEIRVLFRLPNCEFPGPGEYLFTLLVDGEWMAQRRILVVQTEENA